MTTKFVTFGCWNENCCDETSPVFKVLDAIKKQESDSNFFIVTGDNYYPEKIQIEMDGKKQKVKTADIGQLSESFQLLTRSLFGEESEIAAGVAREAAGEAEASSGEGKEIFLLLGNHDVEKTIESKNKERGCYVTLFEKTFAQAFNTNSIHKINFPTSQLVMSKKIGADTLIIMIDTNIYSRENLECYSYLGHGHSEELELQEQLQAEQYQQVRSILGEGQFENIIVCGHNPLIGFKNQVLKDGKIKGGIDVCSKELYELMFSLKLNGKKLYYLCADVHNYQKGDVTISHSSNGNNVLIHQYIVGIGGTELDDDYDEKFDPNFSVSPNDAIGIVEATIAVSDLLNLNYKIEQHFSEFGYLVVTIDHNNHVSFQVKQVPIEQVAASVVASVGGKHTKRRNKRTKRRKKRTKKTSKRRKHTKRK